jgi:glucose-6-phosphate isomerase
MITFENGFKTKISSKTQNNVDAIFKAMKKEKNSHAIGYYTLPQKSKKLIEALQKYEKSNDFIQSKAFKDVVVIGIGGSTLGTKAIYEALKYEYKNQPRLHFLENCDAKEVHEVLSKIKKKKSLFIVISKSGTTIETISLFKYVLQYYKIDLKQKNMAQQFMVITSENSALSLFAQEYGLQEFYIPLNVGGRFSVLSAVGIVPLYLIGFDVQALLQGAKEFKNSFFKKEQQHLLHKAFFYHQKAKKYPINVLFSYSSLLHSFNQWYVQLWGESLGKKNEKGEKVGLTPIGLVGSVDQHSFLQLIIQGPSNKTVTFISVEQGCKKAIIPSMKLPHLQACDFINSHPMQTLLNEQCEATKESLIQEGIEVDHIKLQQLDEYHLGILICYFELLTSVMGKWLHINTYDQPGVELGKIKLIEKFEKR